MTNHVEELAFLLIEYDQVRDYFREADELTDIIIEEMDIQLLMAVQKVCNTNRVVIDWEAVGKMIAAANNVPPISASAIQQHLAKMRTRRQGAGLWVPEPLRKGGNTHGTAGRNGHRGANGRSNGNSGFDDDDDDDDDDPQNDNADPDASYDDVPKPKRVKKEKGVKTENVTTETGVTPGVVKTEARRDSGSSSTKRKRTQSTDNGNEYVGLGAPYMRLEGYTEDNDADSASDDDDIADAEGNGGFVSPGHLEDPFALDNMAGWTTTTSSGGMTTSTGSSVSTGSGHGMGFGMGNGSVNNLANPYGFGLNGYNGHPNGYGNYQLSLPSNGYGSFGAALQNGNGYAEFGVPTTRTANGFLDFGATVPQHGNGYGNVGTTTPQSGSSNYSSQYSAYSTPSGFEGRYHGLPTTAPHYSPIATSQSMFTTSPAHVSPVGSMGPPPRVNYGQYSLPVTPRHHWDMANLGGYGNMTTTPASTGVHVSLGPGFPAVSWDGLPDLLAMGPSTSIANTVAPSSVGGTTDVATANNVAPSSVGTTADAVATLAVEAIADASSQSNVTIDHGNNDPTLPMMANDEPSYAHVTADPPVTEESTQQSTSVYENPNSTEDDFLNEIFSVEIDENDY